MQQRTVILTVTDDPQTNRVAINGNDIRIGYAGEHLATLIKFDLPESWVSDSSIKYQILFLTSDGQKYCTDVLDTAEFAPPSAVMVQGRLYVQVVAVDPNGEIIKKTEICKCLVEPSIADGEIVASTDGVKLAEQLADNLQAVIDEAEEAVNNLKTEVDTASGVLSEITDNYDAFAAFPNQTINIMKNHKNFVDAAGWETVNDGTITAANNVLQIAATNDYGIYGALTRDITVDTIKTVMIKIRAKCTMGANSELKPVWRRNINGNYLTSRNVVAGNLNTLSGNISWTVGNEWQDLWLIAQNAPSEINQIGIIITGGTTIELAHFDVYYSADDIAAQIDNVNAQLDSVEQRVGGVENEIKTACGGVESITKSIDDIQAYIGYQGVDDPDIVGLQVDYENCLFTRLAGADGKTMGADFDIYPMYGGRRRCNVADDGTINAYYGDDTYTDDGTNGQVMVYQPKFYYRVVPLKLDKNDEGLGYHIRKANYYVSAVPKTGFKLHPAFYDENGNPIDYILYSAYEGSYWDDSMGRYFNDGTDTDTATDTANDRICSVAGVKPISGLRKNLTRANAEHLAAARGAGWHIETIKSLSATQLLMMIEMGTMNSQSVIGRGVVNITGDTNYNCSSITGSTTSIGNGTGQATETINEIAGIETAYTDNGKTAISYRGMENPWGNVGKHINGINILGDGTMLGGEAYIASDFNFDEQKNSENYQSTGIRIANGSGWIKSMGYNNAIFDWIMLPTDMGGTSTLPIGDYCYIAANNKLHRYPVSGGSYASSLEGGLFYSLYSVPTDSKLRTYNARILYVPTATTDRG